MGNKDNILKKIHYVIFLLTLLSCFNLYQGHQDELELVINRKPTLEREIRDLKEKLELARTFKDDLEQSKQKLIEVTSDIEEIQRQLPSSIEDSEVLDLFGKEADLMNIRDLSLRPGEEEKRDFYYVKDYEITARGTFLQFLIYFERLASNSRLINVTELEIAQSGNKKESRGRFQLVNLKSKMEVFRYDPNYKEDSGIEKIENQFKKPVKKSNKKKPRRRRKKA